MTVPSREEVARRVAERLLDSGLVDESDGADERWFLWLLDDLARSGHPVVMGYDHPHCLYCRGTGRMPIGTRGRTEPCDHPGDKGRPVYWEAP